MAAVRILVFFIAPLLLLSTLPIYHGVHATEMTTKGQAADALVNNTGQGMAAMVARNRDLGDLMRSGGTLEMWMVLICVDLQDIVAECSTVQDFDTFFPNLPRVNAERSRRKRFSSRYWNVHYPRFGSSYGYVHRPWYGRSYTRVYKPSPSRLYVHPYPGSGSSTSNTVVCPSPIDQSLIYALNPDSAGYPAGDIGNEIVNSGDLQNCLARQVLRPNDPPTILVESFELTANVTCPFDLLRLWQYQSQAINAMCWVLQNFQENILYSVCNTRFCQNCADAPTTRTTQRDNRNQRFCITEYRTVSLWAYCPTLTPGNRIIRDRIIVPFTCSCQSIRCDPVPTQGGK